MNALHWSWQYNSLFLSEVFFRPYRFQIITCGLQISTTNTPPKKNLNEKLTFGLVLDGPWGVVSFCDLTVHAQSYAFLSRLLKFASPDFLACFWTVGLFNWASGGSFVWPLARPSAPWWDRKMISLLRFSNCCDCFLTSSWRLKISLLSARRLDSWSCLPWEQTWKNVMNWTLLC